MKKQRLKLQSNLQKQDHQQLYKELMSSMIKSIRGTSSAHRLSRKMGYSFNQIGRWEAKTTTVKWKDFLRLLKIRKISMARACLQIGLLPDKSLRASHLLEQLIAGQEIEQVTSLLGVSRHQLRRWLKDETGLPVSVILSAVDQFKNSMPEFISFLCPIDKIEQIQGQFLAHEKERLLHAEFPKIGALLRVLELREYRDLKGAAEDWIARKIGLSREETQHLLGKLGELNIIVKQANKYLLKRHSLNLLSGEKAHSVKLFWLNEARLRLESSPSSERRRGGQDIFAYNVFSVSEETWEKIVKRYLQFYQELKNLLKSDDDERLSSVKVFCAQFFEL